MYAWPKFHSSSPFGFWEDDLNAKKNWQNLKKQWTVKCRLRLNFDESIKLLFTKCMHDPSFIALALIVCEKSHLNPNTQQKFTPPTTTTPTITTTPEKQYICLASSHRLENKSTASGAKYARRSVIFPHRMAFDRGRLMQWRRDQN